MPDLPTTFGPGSVETPDYLNAVSAAVNALVAALGGKKLAGPMTLAAYTALATKDGNTLYLVSG